MIVLTGATAMGKSDVGVELALLLNGEIISADSMQLYRGCNIGTGKITGEEMRGVRHHLIDVINPDEEFSVQRYRECADVAISDVLSRGKLPIVVGGTVFYIWSLLFDLELGNTLPSKEIRDKYQRIFEEKGSGYLFDMLKEIDPKSAEILHENDIKRVIRALEIFEVSGKRKSEMKSGRRARYKDYKLFFLNTDREVLYQRINRRVDSMVEKGLIEEAKSLQKYRQCNSMQAIGYKEIFDYLDGVLTLDEAVELVKKNSRNYAKRQLTFFKKLEGIMEIRVDFPCTMSDIVGKICTMSDIVLS